jgi:hypothetical protein
MLKPLYIHDCPKCKLIATKFSKYLESEVDVYESCEQVADVETRYIIRFSDEGSDYACTYNPEIYV